MRNQDIEMLNRRIDSVEMKIDDLNNSLKLTAAKIIEVAEILERKGILDIEY